MDGAGDTCRGRRLHLSVPEWLSRHGTWWRPVRGAGCRLRERTSPCACVAYHADPVVASMPAAAAPPPPVRRLPVRVCFFPSLAPGSRRRRQAGDAREPIAHGRSMGCSSFLPSCVSGACQLDPFEYTRTHFPCAGPAGSFLMHQRTKLSE